MHERAEGLCQLQIGVWENHTGGFLEDGACVAMGNERLSIRILYAVRCPWFVCKGSLTYCCHPWHEMLYFFAKVCRNVF